MLRPPEKPLRLTTFVVQAREDSKYPAIIKCFGSRPDFLRRMIDLGNTVHFSEGHLSRRHKEMIASYVSYLNRCPY